jgi:hypothetical protein
MSSTRGGGRGVRGRGGNEFVAAGAQDLYGSSPVGYGQSPSQRGYRGGAFDGPRPADNSFRGTNPRGLGIGRPARGGASSGYDQRAAAVPAAVGPSASPAPATKPTKPLYRAAGASIADAAKGAEYEEEAKVLIQRLRPETRQAARATATSAAATSNANKVELEAPLAFDERRRLAELCLVLLDRYPRHANRIGAMAVLWSGYLPKVKAAEAAALEALRALNEAKLSELFQPRQQGAPQAAARRGARPAAPPLAVPLHSVDGSSSQGPTPWDLWVGAKTSLDAVVRDAHSRVSAVLDGLRKFGNSTDGRRLAFRGRLCLGDLFRYDDGVAARAYAAAQRIVSEAQADEARNEAKYGVIEFGHVANGLMTLPVRSSHYVLHRLHRAIDEYEKARQLCPAHGQVYNSMAIVHETGRSDALQATFGFARALTAPEKPFTQAMASIFRLCDKYGSNLLFNLAANDQAAVEDDMPATSAAVYNELTATYLVAVRRTLEGPPLTQANGTATARALRRFIASKQAAPADRVFIRMVVCAAMLDLYQAQMSVVRGSATVDSPAGLGSPFTAASATALGGKSDLTGFMFQALVHALLSLPSDAARQALISTDLGAAITLGILLAHDREEPAVQPLLNFPDAAAQATDQQGDNFGRGATGDLLKPVTHTCLDPAEHDALRRLVRQAAEGSKVDLSELFYDVITCPGGSAPLDPFLVAEDVSEAGSIAPEDAECLGMHHAQLQAVSQRLELARRLITRRVEALEADGDSQEPRPAVVGALPAAAPIDEYRRRNDRGLTSPAMGGSELLHLRLARLDALLDPRYRCPPSVGFQAASAKATQQRVELEEAQSRRREDEIAAQLTRELLDDDEDDEGDEILHHHTASAAGWFD